MSRQSLQQSDPSMRQPNHPTRAAMRRRMLGPHSQSAARGLDPSPSTRMFAQIRLRLALQYTAVLAALLLLAGLLLYFGMQHQLLDPTAGQLQHEAQQETQEWQQSGQPPAQCLGQGEPEPLPYLVACYTPQGTLIGTNLPQETAADFATPGTAQNALANPSQSLTDIVTVDGRFGAESVMRYTTAVFDSSGHQVLGVVQLGLDVTQYVDALHTLLVLLFVVGAITLLCSLGGGALLASRALAPARLAFTRQQQFIADASHELRTPITLLRADAEVLLRGRDNLPPDDAPLLDDIVTETEHMGALAENLLTLARLDSGGYHLEQEIVDLSALAESVARRMRSLADERHIQLAIEQTSGTAGTAETLVVGDSMRLEEVALILVDNAVKYNSPGGAVTLRTYRDGQHAVFEVRDSGIGIPAEHLQRLGERFYRVDKARSRQMGGAGLGISIAHGIAAMHRGTLTLSSVPDQGTTATLRLPAVEIAGGAS